jgi:phosphohistidine phosphatase
VSREGAVEIVLFRHGPAGTRDPRRWPDDLDRPLTAEGKGVTQLSVKGLFQLLPRAFRVISSPAIRARMTAEIVQQELQVSAPVEVWKELAPGSDPENVLERCRALQDPGRPWVLVGHEPTLSELVGLSASGTSRSVVNLGTAGAADLSFDEGVDRGTARLRWLMTADQLSSLWARPSH